MLPFTAGQLIPPEKNRNMETYFATQSVHPILTPRTCTFSNGTNLYVIGNNVQGSFPFEPFFNRPSCQLPLTPRIRTF